MSNTHPLPHNLPGLEGLTPHSGTRELLNLLTAQYRARDASLARSRLALEAWADALATGDGKNHRMAFTCRDRHVSISEFFAGMDRAQAGRFLAELFTDWIPHAASRNQGLADLARGRTEAGVPVSREGFLARVAAAIQALDPTMDVLGTIEVQALTWVDDRTSAIHARGVVEMEVGLGIDPCQRAHQP